MENQINMGSLNTQQIGQNPINQPTTVSEKHGVNYWKISTVVFAILLLVTIFFYFIKIRNQQETNIIDQKSSSTPTSVLLPSPTINQKENWIIYDKRSQFVLKYSPEYSIERESLSPRNYYSPVRGTYNVDIGDMGLTSTKGGIDIDFFDLKNVDQKKEFSFDGSNKNIISSSKIEGYKYQIDKVKVEMDTNAKPGYDKQGMIYKVDTG